MARPLSKLGLSGECEPGIRKQAIRILFFKAFISLRNSMGFALSTHKQVIICGDYINTQIFVLCFKVISLISRDTDAADLTTR